MKVPTITIPSWLPAGMTSSLGNVGKVNRALVFGSSAVGSNSDRRLLESRMPFDRRHVAAVVVALRVSM